MGRSWDELTSSQDKNLLEEKGAVDDKEKTSFEFKYDKATGGSKSDRQQAEQLIESGRTDFKAGGCKPDGDGEIKCRFDLGENVTKTVKKRTNIATVTFK
ncbi:MAG: hypothetical protein ABEI78_02425, partial [Candidatus Nanohaloarchaea archaeon]